MVLARLLVSYSHNRPADSLARTVAGVGNSAAKHIHLNGDLPGYLRGVG